MINPADINAAVFNAQGSKIDSIRNSYVNMNKKTAAPMDDEALKKTAQEFEAVFLTKFLETMDSTVQKGEFLHGGKGEETFRSMMHQQMATNIAQNPATSFGLADQIYRQMKDRV